MSSSPRSDPPVLLTRIWSPRTWSLRARLLVTQVILLAVVCAGIGIATEFALQRFLTHQLDQQLIEAGRRSAAIFAFGPPPPPGFGSPPPPGFGSPRPMPEEPYGPPPGHSRRIIINEDEGPGPQFLNAAQLAQIAASRSPTTVDLDGLGRYRVVGNHSRGPEETIVVGLPTSHVDDTLLWVLVMFCIVAAIALVAAATAGILITRRQFRPLATVSAAARQVADLELERGEVSLPSPIVKVDPASAHTEIGQLGSALNRMLDRIAGALSARYASEMRVRQFVADASHELRTPLAAIRGYTELAQRKQDVLPEEVAHAMSRVESETERMTHLVEDMLLLARLDTGRPLQRDQVDLSRLVVDAASDAHIAGPDHQWSLDLPDEPVMVRGDEARLHQVLANLLANARTHTPPGTSVITSLALDDDHAVLTVVDDGPGIPVWLQPEVFERFARGDSSRSRREGSTGLGLAIVAAVVRAHHGTIDVHSVAGNTEFVVKLPVNSQSSHSGARTDA
jgi:two-component system OmpR family sensor kinase